MTFLNKYILRSAAIAIVLSVAFFFALDHFIEMESGVLIIISSISYGVSMFLNGMINGRKDIYEGHYGYNYHLSAYIISCTVPLVMALTGMIHKHFVDTAIQMYFYWGITLGVHTIVYIMLRRKRAIKGFDKEEVFE